MNERNQYQTSYTYDTYDQQPLSYRQEGMLDRIFGEAIADKLRSPVVATVSLLVFAGLFAMIIFSVYPDSPDDAGQVPVVQADNSIRDFRAPPEDTGGMTISNRDSQIFDVMNQQAMQNRKVENLLAPSEPSEEPLDRSALIQQAEEARRDAQAVKADVMQAVEEDADTTMEASFDSPSNEGLEKPEIAAVETNDSAAADNETVSGTASSDAPPEAIHPAGSSPETLAFVRSVLDKKDGAVESDDGSSAAAVQPAAGAATGSASAIEAGSYYIQVGSVRSEGGAHEEWPKIQKMFSPNLSNVDYRVNRADLGDKGVYYRIQAGPMSKDSATSICNKIKAQKPGGCLVVK